LFLVLVPFPGLYGRSPTSFILVSFFVSVAFPFPPCTLVDDPYIFFFNRGLCGKWGVIPRPNSPVGPKRYFFLRLPYLTPLCGGFPFSWYRQHLDHPFCPFQGARPTFLGSAGRLDAFPVTRVAFLLWESQFRLSLRQQLEKLVPMVLLKDLNPIPIDPPSASSSVLPLPSPLPASLKPLRWFPFLSFTRIQA